MLYISTTNHQLRKTQVNYQMLHYIQDEESRLHCIREKAWLNYLSKYKYQHSIIETYASPGSSIISFLFPPSNGFMLAFSTVETSFSSSSLNLSTLFRKIPVKVTQFSLNTILFSSHQQSDKFSLTFLSSHHIPGLERCMMEHYQRLTMLLKIDNLLMNE